MTLKSALLSFQDHTDSEHKIYYGDSNEQEEIKHHLHLAEVKEVESASYTPKKQLAASR